MDSHLLQLSCWNPTSLSPQPPYSLLPTVCYCLDIKNYIVVSHSTKARFCWLALLAGFVHAVSPASVEGFFNYRRGYSFRGEKKKSSRGGKNERSKGGWNKHQEKFSTEQSRGPRLSSTCRHTSVPALNTPRTWLLLLMLLLLSLLTTRERTAVGRCECKAFK